MEGRKRAEFVGNVRGIQEESVGPVASISEQQLRGACGTVCVGLWGARSVGSLHFLARITSSGHQLFLGVSLRAVPVGLRVPYFALANNRLIILLNSFGSYDEGYTD